MNNIPELPKNLNSNTTLRKKQPGPTKSGAASGYMEIKHILTGSITYTFDGVTKTVYPGETVVLNPYDEFSSKVEEYTEHYGFSLDSQKHYDDLGIPALTKFENFIGKDEVLVYICNGINAEYENQHTFHENMLISLTNQLLIHLYRNYSRNTEASPSSHLLGKHKIARLAIDYIYRNCHKGVTTGEISAYINVSTSHLCRCFKEATGVSVIEYAERLRCRKAKEDLSLGTYSVTQVAEKYHFSSLSYFNRRYKKYCGINPAKTLAEAKKKRTSMQST